MKKLRLVILSGILLLSACSSVLKSRDNEYLPSGVQPVSKIPPGSVLAAK